MRTTKPLSTVLFELFLLMSAVTVAVCALLFAIFYFFDMVRPLNPPREVVSSTLPINLLWQTTLDAPVVQAPVLTTDYALVVTHSLLYALDIRSGEIKWRYPIEAGLYSAPVVVADDLVIIGQQRAQVIALDLHSGNLRWTEEVGDFRDEWITIHRLVIGDGLVVASTVPKALAIEALALEDGARVWEIRPWGAGIDAVWDSYIIGGRLYLMDFDQTHIVNPTTGKVVESRDGDRSKLQSSGDYLLDSYYLFNARTLRPILQLERPVEQGWLSCDFRESHVAVMGDWLYNRGGCGGVYAASLSSGKVRWHYRPDLGATLPLVVYHDHVYALLTNGEIHAISTLDGANRGVLKTNKGVSGVVTNADLSSSGLTTNSEVIVATFNELMVFGLGVAQE